MVGGVDVTPNLLCKVRGERERERERRQTILKSANMGTRWLAGNCPVPGEVQLPPY